MQNCGFILLKKSRFQHYEVAENSAETTTVTTTATARVSKTVTGNAAWDYLVLACASLGSANENANAGPRVKITQGATDITPESFAGVRVNDTYTDNGALLVDVIRPSGSAEAFALQWRNNRIDENASIADAAIAILPLRAP
jgi:hypothetical protein